MFSFVGSAQETTDFKGNIKELGLTPLSGEIAGKVKIQINYSFGQWCFRDAAGCSGTLNLPRIANKNGKYDLKWSLESDGDFKMPNAKLFTPKSTGSDLYVFIPQQVLVFNKNLGTFEATIEFYKK